MTKETYQILTHVTSLFQPTIYTETDDLEEKEKINEQRAIRLVKIYNYFLENVQGFKHTTLTLGQESNP